MKNPKSEFALAKESFADLPSVDRIKIVSLPQHDSTGSEDIAFPDRWVRDWGPSHVDKNLVYNQNHLRGTYANPEFEKSSNLLN